MIVCICNNIKDSDIKNNPLLLEQCGTKCGSCKPTVKDRKNKNESNIQ